MNQIQRGIKTQNLYPGGSNPEIYKQKSRSPEMNKSDIHAIAFHGWGLDSSFWNPLEKRLSHFLNLQKVDRGYFLNSSNATFSDEPIKNRIIFAHSLSLHLCPENVLSEADHLIIFSGFLRFYPESKKQSKRKKLQVRQWITQLVDQPQEVLQEYYDLAFYPDEPHIPARTEMDHDKLLSDLTMLDRDKNNLQSFFEVPRITILHGADDKIVSQERAREMYHSLRFNSQYFEILHAGHALAHTHADKCADIIETVLSE